MGTTYNFKVWKRNIHEHVSFTKVPPKQEAVPGGRLPPYPTRDAGKQNYMLQEYWFQVLFTAFTRVWWKVMHKTTFLRRQEKCTASGQKQTRELTRCCKSGRQAASANPRPWSANDAGILQTMNWVKIYPSTSTPLWKYTMTVNNMVKKTTPGAATYKSDLWYPEWQVGGVRFLPSLKRHNREKCFRRNNATWLITTVIATFFHQGHCFDQYTSAFLECACDRFL